MITCLIIPGIGNPTCVEKRNAPYDYGMRRVSSKADPSKIAASSSHRSAPRLSLPGQRLSRHARIGPGAERTCFRIDQNRSIGADAPGAADEDFMAAPHELSANGFRDTVFDAHLAGIHCVREG